MASLAGAPKAVNLVARAKFGAGFHPTRQACHPQRPRSGALRTTTKSSVAKVMTQIRTPSRLLFGPALPVLASLLSPEPRA